MASVSDSFQKGELVPDVVPVAPQQVVEVEFDSGVKCNFGNELTPTQVRNAPTRVSWPSDANSLYTLCMTDPDVPSRKEPKMREWHHWLVVNIKGCDLSSGRTLSEYVGSGPPPNTGLHRYVYLVYKQAGAIEPTEPLLTNRSKEGRPNFSIANFAAKYNLGNPIAGNYYEAQYDDYCPKLYEQLSGK